MEDREFVKGFEKKVRETIRRYKLVSKKDRVLVACSGGKDSTAVLYLLNKFGYKAEGFIIDLEMGKWSEVNLKNLKKFCKEHRFKLHVVPFKDEVGHSVCYARSIIQSRENLQSCQICGILKRWIMNKKARELGATVIATGHNLDDEAQTALMNVFSGNPKIGLNIGPRTGTIEDEKFITRIKPLFFCSESDTRRYSETVGFKVLYDRCPCSKDSYRAFVRDSLNGFEDKYPGTKENIVRSSLFALGEVKRGLKVKRPVLHCKVCGEPSNNSVCRACEMIGKLRD